MLVGAALVAGAFATVAGYAAPGDVAILAARTADAASGARNGDGYIDGIAVTFSGPMNVSATPKRSSGPGDPGFRVQGYEIDPSTPFAWDSSTALRIRLVQGATMDTGATPQVIYEGPNGGLVPQTGNEPAPTQTTALDGAGPVLRSFLANDQGGGNMFNAIGDEAHITFSEPATLAGALPIDRFTNLERAIRFTWDAGSVGCSRDGVGVPTDRNFPQPGNAGDPLVSPSGPTDYQQTFVVRQKDSIGSSPAYTFAAIPTGCWAGIDEQYFELISDRAGNMARHQGEPGAIPSPNARRVRINPTDVAVTAVRTVDADADGSLDGIQITLDQNVDDATLQGSLTAFTVSQGETTAAVTGIDTGTANDRLFTLNFASSWGTGVLPTVSYAKPGDCTSTGGTGVKGSLPSPGWKACLGSFSTQATDAAQPVVTASSTRDVNSNGIIDRVRVSLSEPLSAIAAGGWRVGGQNATAASLDASDASKANIDFAEAVAPNTGLIPSFSFNGTTSNSDAAGNRVRHFTGTVGADGAPPVMLEVAQYDNNTDGRIDRAVVTMSERLGPLAQGAAARFTVGGSTATSATWVGDGVVDLGLAPIATTAPGDLVYTPGSPGVSDGSGNQVAARTIPAGQVLDRAAPVGVISIAPQQPVRAGTATVTVDYSEPMDAAVAPTVIFAGKPVNAVVDLDHGLTGYRSGDGSIWDGTVTIVEADCTVATGCPATATADGASDPATNGQIPASLETEIDTIAPAVLSLGTFERAGGAAPADVLNMFTDGFSLGAAVQAGHAEGGYADLLVDGSALSPAARDTTISGSDTSVRPATGFADRAALQAAVGEGSHSLSIRLCDDAGNCSTSADPHAISADYTPVAISLTEPAQDRAVRGGSILRIEWDGDEGAADFDRVELHHSADGGQTYRPINLAAGDADDTYDWRVPATSTRSGRVRVRAYDVNGNRTSDTGGILTVDVTADFNGDGASDLAIGAPGEAIGRAAGAGVVHTIHGGDAGLHAGGTRAWNQGSGGIAGAAESGDGFGAALARGDFNGDGRTDLAIAAPGEDLGTIADAGLVHVLYAGPGGISGSGSQTWTQGSGGIADRAESGDRFGAALAVADFDADGYADLAIGVPGEDGGRGLTHVLYGSANRLTAARSAVFTQDTPGVPGASEAGDEFGASLTASDLNGDGYADLAVGLPSEDVGSLVDAGALVVLPGSSSGVSGTGSKAWTQSSPGIAGSAEAGDRWTASLASGDFDGDGYADIAAGAPGEDIGRIRDAGATSITYGSGSGLSTRGESLYQGPAGIAGRPETGDGFGASLAAGDFDGDGRDDLAIGVPAEDLGRLSDAGVSHVLYGHTGGLRSGRKQVWSQDSPSVPGRAEAGDRFGEALAATDADGDGNADLAIGVPGEAFGPRADTGLLHLLPGTGAGLNATGGQLWSQDAPGIPGRAEAGDRFGGSAIA